MGKPITRSSHRTTPPGSLPIPHGTRNKRGHCRRLRWQRGSAQRVHHRHSAPSILRETVRPYFLPSVWLPAKSAAPDDHTDGVSSKRLINRFDEIQHLRNIDQHGDGYAYDGGAVFLDYLQDASMRYVG